MSAPSAPRTGVLAEWHDSRGFGFIAPSDGGRRLFVHVSAFGSAGPRPNVGDRVAFEVGAGRDGRPRAARARVLATSAAPSAPRRAGERMPAPRPRRRGPVALLPFLTVLAFAVFLALAVALWGASAWWVLLYAGMSAIAFAMYAWDKRAAIEHAWRTRESTLQAAALLCGWPGAILAQQLLRHKNRKAGFQLVFWLLVIVNIGAFTVLVWRSELVDHLAAAVP
ncbi:MAG: cold shock and DUF1294 domain-containing protein [Microbacteriaceae bacterium]|nr:cold shock and DUF1294 domain-containing protein [Microbacteriaceae bacterium]MCL2795019.1 cold shock and DUF1294 domain-containing protein [Microbacteriaceae bacterium]